MLRKRVGATYVPCGLKNFELFVTLHTSVRTVRYPAHNSPNCSLPCTQQSELFVTLHTTVRTLRYPAHNNPNCSLPCTQQSELYVTLHTTVRTVRYPAHNGPNCTLPYTQQSELYVTLHTTPLTMYDTRITRGQFSDIYNVAGKSYVCRPSKRWTELRLGWLMSYCCRQSVL